LGDHVCLVDGALDDLLFVRVEIAGEVLVKGGLFLLEDCLVSVSGRSPCSVGCLHAVGLNLVEWCLEKAFLL
jgi:hypothetical protein